MARFLSSLILGTACLISGVHSSAQSVDISQLAAAQSYDTGPLDLANGGLDPSLWQGISADRAQLYISNIDGTNLSELSSVFFRRVILSAGVPPNGDVEQKAAFDRARTTAQLKLGDKLALETLSNSQNPLQRDAVFRAQLALSSGDSEAACSEADREIDDRSAPFWMQMRIICHIIRDETAAAELTLNLLREQEDADPNFSDLADYVLGLRKAAPTDIPLGDPLLDTLRALRTGDETGEKSGTAFAAVALSDAASPDERLAALFKAKNQLSTDQVTSILSSLLISNLELAGGTSFDIDTTLAGLQDEATLTKSVAQAYNLAKNIDRIPTASQAVAVLLNFSESVDYVPQMSRHLSDVIAFIPAARQAELDAERFAWAALRQGDLSTLASIYRELAQEDPLASRIALAADALGNGFVLGQLGVDIETRLDGSENVRKQAVRDSLIALALGAQLSDKAALSLNLVSYDKAEQLNPLNLAEIDALAKSGAHAGTLLKVVASMGEREPKDLSNLEIYSYLSALSTAGLAREAGELAAHDFLSRAPKAE
ncbi:MAG: hypothetical protein ABJ275_11570 [Maricaulaceae bacterium]